jgi:hypothetical protein
MIFEELVFITEISRVFITNIKLSTLFKEIIAIHSDYHTKHIIHPVGRMYNYVLLKHIVTSGF